MRAIGGPLRTPHTDNERIHTHFKWRRRVKCAEVLKKMARGGDPMEIRTGGDLTNELAYGNMTYGE